MIALAFGVLATKENDAFARIHAKPILPADAAPRLHAGGGYRPIDLVAFPAGPVRHGALAKDADGMAPAGRRAMPQPLIP
jgi:hypothetical protein